MVSALIVGNNFLQRGFKEDIDITPMKLQKLVYFTYRDYLKSAGTPLFSERFEAWRYGPVVSSIYDRYKNYGSNAIRQYATENDGQTILTVNEATSPVFYGVIENVWNHCKSFDGIYLSSLTHQSGTAWSKAIDNGLPYLSDDDIRDEVIDYV